MGGPGRWPNKRRQRQHQRTGPTGDGVDEPISAPNRPALSIILDDCWKKQMRAVTPHERRRWVQQEGNLGLLNRNRPPPKTDRLAPACRPRVVGQPCPQAAATTARRHGDSSSSSPLSLFSPSGHRRGQMRLHQHRYRPKAPCPCTTTTTIYINSRHPVRFLAFRSLSFCFACSSRDGRSCGRRPTLPAILATRRMMWRCVAAHDFLLVRIVVI
jgi:hypothetical protein